MENLIYILSVALLFVFVFFLIKSSAVKNKEKNSPKIKKEKAIFIETPEAEFTETETSILEFARNNPEKTAFVIRQMFFSDDE
ncbi:MAG: hypothetical protein C0601_00150 [Candidatus Muiribacterium halophilum]|uniref:Uncharacterized protein n=1 Tax=Muiribacterium halophilum TaxID=2053465 RepID=A0A2N5ZNA8_MUIH1|nr:MAG: hypothetical protein C0601_00150 [Candidatus Muirbacterium halophilum]